MYENKYEDKNSGTTFSAFYCAGKQMPKDVCKGMKGEIWMVTENCFRSSNNFSCSESIGVLLNRRPVLILSEDSYNRIHPIRLVVKIGTSHGRNSEQNPFYIPFSDNTGRSSVIFCDQIETISVNSLDFLKYQISDSIMRQVEEAVGNLCGARANLQSGILFSIEKQFQELNRLKDWISAAKETIQQIKEEKGGVEKELSALSDDATSFFKQETKGSPEDGPSVSCRTSETFPFNDEENKITANSIKQESFWTTDRIKEFFYDCNHMVPGKIAKKWNIRATEIASLKKELHEKARKRGVLLEMSKRNKISWTKKLADEFLKDYYEMSREQCAEKWDCEPRLLSKRRANIVYRYNDFPDE